MNTPKHPTDAPAKKPPRDTASEDSAPEGSPSGHGSKYERTKHAVIEALLTQRNLEEAARAAGISKQTLNRYLKRPDFQADYREARRAVVSQSRARLQQATPVAVSALLKVVVDPNTPPAARVRAADCVLKHATEALQQEDMLVRIETLEQRRDEAATTISLPKAA